MSKSIIIDPGHGGTDTGAIGFGVREKDWCLKMGLYHYDRLKELGARVGITRKDDRTLNSGPRTNLIRGKYDYCLSEHWNAFNGQARGVETIYSLRASDRFARNVANALVNVSGFPLRRVFQRSNSRGTDYYFMHRLTGSTETIITEYGFLDNRTDHNWYLNKDNFYRAGEAVLKEVCEQIGITYKAPSSSNQPDLDIPVISGTLYRVQMGAFGKLENAENLQEKLEGENIETYMIRDQGLFKIQVGAYSKKENAEAQAKIVEEAGFDTYITTASGSPAHGTKDEPTQPVAVTTPRTSESRTVSVGDKVTLSSSASNYATGEKIPSSVKNKSYTVKQTRPGEILLEEIMSWVHSKDVTEGSTPASSGNRVTLSNSATHYATGERIPSSIKGRTYTVLQTKPGRILLQEIMSWVHSKDVTGGASPKPKPIRTGDRVRLKNSASRYATGERIPSNRKGTNYTVMQTRSGEVLLKEILSWVNVEDVRR